MLNAISSVLTAINQAMDSLTATLRRWQGRERSMAEAKSKEKGIQNSHGCSRQ